MCRLVLRIFHYNLSLSDILLRGVFLLSYLCMPYKWVFNKGCALVAFNVPRKSEVDFLSYYV